MGSTSKVAPRNNNLSRSEAVGGCQHMTHAISLFSSIWGCNHPGHRFILLEAPFVMYRRMNAWATD